MCRYAAMNTHKPGNKGRQDATTYHKKRLLGGKAEVNGSEGVGLMRAAGERSGRIGGMMSQIDRDRNHPKAGRDVSKISEPQ